MGGNGDNIIRLINPNGSANPGLVGESEQFVCAMIYVFDDDEEMGECCGCPVSSADPPTLSVERKLTSNFVEGGNPDQNTQGVIAIVATAPTGIDDAGFPICSPTGSPGYSVGPSVNLLGSIIRNQTVATGTGSISGLTETPLFDDASGDQTNLAYLQAECGELIGNGSGRGLCNCFAKGPPPTPKAVLKCPLQGFKITFFGAFEPSDCQIQNAFRGFCLGSTSLASALAACTESNPKTMPCETSGTASCTYATLWGLSRLVGLASKIRAFHTGSPPSLD